MRKGERGLGGEWTDLGDDVGKTSAEGHLAKEDIAVVFWRK
jgi:hypothetical protein